MTRSRPRLILPGSEAEFAAWWVAGGALHQQWTTADERLVRVLFAGRPGGPSGPDFRDAVILLDGTRCTGDIELHLRAAGWHAHGHATDPRYNQVILHVIAQGPLPPTSLTPLASGATIPIVLLADWRQTPPVPASPWPCQATELPIAWDAHLRRWGAARFALRTARFHTELAAAGATLDNVLLGAITEALGYGRMHETTRQARLTGVCLALPQGLDQLSLRRLEALGQILQGWQLSPGATCCGTLLASGETAAWERLLALFASVGKARAAIVIWNAVLPALAAYGDICRNVALSRLARQVAAAAPGLPGNTITRSMTRWLGIAHAPADAIAQQGLHHVHTQWCRAKTCAICPASRLHDEPALQDRHAL